MLPVSGEPCFIIMQEKTRTSYHGHAPSYTDTEEYVDTRTFTNEDEWNSEVAALYRRGEKFYAGQVTPATVTMSIKVGLKNPKRARREPIPQYCRRDYRSADGTYPLECGKAYGHSGPCGG